MLYAVLDCGKQANEVGFPYLKGRGWTQNVYPTFEQAREYAWRWLGSMGGSFDGKTGAKIGVGQDEGYHYDGHGSIITIVEVPKPKEVGFNVVPSWEELMDKEDFEKDFGSYIGDGWHKAMNDIALVIKLDENIYLVSIWNRSDPREDLKRLATLPLQLDVEINGWPEKELQK